MPIEYEVARKETFDDSIIGGLYLEGKWFCYTLEGAKVAIPCGRYRLTIDWSERFQCLMPHILDVPGRTGIRMHSGNKAVDTAGCPLLGGKYHAEDHTILDSRATFWGFFMPRLKEDLKKDEVWITIS
jgi:hypothetical protein